MVQLGGGPCSGVISGLGLGAAGWDYGYGSVYQGHRGGYISIKYGLKRYITISDRF